MLQGLPKDLGEGGLLKDQEVLVEGVMPGYAKTSRCEGSVSVARTYQVPLVMSGLCSWFPGEAAFSSFGQYLDRGRGSPSLETGRERRRGSTLRSRARENEGSPLGLQG